MPRVLPLALVLAASSCGATAPGPTPPPGTSHASTPPGPAAAAPPPADAGPPPPLDHDMPRLADLSVDMYRDVASALQADSCAIATGKLRVVVQADAEVIGAIARVAKDGRTKDLRAELDTRSAALGVSAKAIAASPLIKTCAADKDFAAALDGFVGVAQ